MGGDEKSGAENGKMTRGVLEVPYDRFVSSNIVVILKLLLRLIILKASFYGILDFWGLVHSTGSRPTIILRSGMVLEIIAKLRPLQSPKKTSGF